MANLLDQLVHPRSAYPDMGFAAATLFNAEKTPKPIFGHSTEKRRDLSAYRLAWNLVGGVQRVTPAPALFGILTPSRPHLNIRGISPDTIDWIRAPFQDAEQRIAGIDAFTRSRRTEARPSVVTGVGLHDGWQSASLLPRLSAAVQIDSLRFRTLERIDRNHQLLGQDGWWQLFNPATWPWSFDSADRLPSAATWDRRLQSFEPVDWITAALAALDVYNEKKWPGIEELWQSQRMATRGPNPAERLLWTRQPMGAADKGAQTAAAIGWSATRMAGRETRPPIYLLNLGRMNAAIEDATAIVWPAFDFLYRSARSLAPNTTPRPGEHVTWLKPYDPRLGVPVQIAAIRAATRSGLSIADLTLWPAAVPTLDLGFVSATWELWNAFRTATRDLAPRTGDVNNDAVIWFPSPVEPTKLVGVQQLLHSFRAGDGDRVPRLDERQNDWLGKLAIDVIASYYLLMVPNTMIQTSRTASSSVWRPLDLDPATPWILTALLELQSRSPLWLTSFRLREWDRSPRISDIVGWWKENIPIPPNSYQPKLWPALDFLSHSFRAGSWPWIDVLTALRPTLHVPQRPPSIACWGTETAKTDVACQGTGTVATTPTCADTATTATTPDCDGTPPVGIL